MVKLFLSHASEDKEAFVRSLAIGLKRVGFEVWYDEFSLKPGDSLRRSIDQGLAKCNAGIVIISPSFFAKEWPQRELDALYTAEINGQSQIVPIWYEIESSDVASFSPLLADRIAIQAQNGVRQVVEQISELFEVPKKLTGNEIADRIEVYLQVGESFASESLWTGCRHRFLSLNAYKEEYGKFLDQVTADIPDEDLDIFLYENENQISEELEKLRVKFEIPQSVYLTTAEPVRVNHLSSYLHDIGQWSSGTLSRKKSGELVRDLDHDELDEYFILLNVPNFLISDEHRALLELALVELGCWFETGDDSIDEVVEKLRITKYKS